jgi:hypothetical protein
VAEHLAATPAAPIHVTVQGPVVLRVELRRRSGDEVGSATIDARPARGDSVVRTAFVRGARDAETRGSDVGGVSLPEVVELPLPQAAPYAVEVRTRLRLVLARLGVWEGIADSGADPPAPLAFVSHEPVPALAPQTLQEAPVVTLVDGDVAPGLDDLGSVGVWMAAHRVSTDPEGAPVQTMSSLRVGATYRRLVERAHTTLKLDGAERFNAVGAPSQAFSTSLFFIHPEHRSLRFGLDADVRTQPIDNQREWSGRLSLLVEPVVTLMPGLHLVSKVASWWSRRTLETTTAALLPFIDPEVFSAYSQSHPRALAWEEGLEGEPFLNVVLYSNVRATTNRGLSPTDLDHVSAALFARALFGRSYVEALGRTTWFLADADRGHATRHTWLGGRFFHTLWPNERHLVELGAVAGYDFGTHAPELSASLVWEWSNGRRFADHSAREGEDFFFAERGPGFGTSQLRVSP